MAWAVPSSAPLRVLPVLSALCQSGPVAELCPPHTPGSVACFLGGEVCSGLASTSSSLVGSEGPG